MPIWPFNYVVTRRPGGPRPILSWPPASAAQAALVSQAINDHKADPATECGGAAPGAEAAHVAYYMRVRTHLALGRCWVFPASAKLELPNASWLTFRRTYASWAHDKGVPGKVVAQLMGHTNADVTINVYTQVMDASLRTAVDRIGGELFTIVHEPETGSGLSR